MRMSASSSLSSVWSSVTDAKPMPWPTKAAGPERDALMFSTIQPGVERR